MRLCTFEVGSRFGAVERVGVQTADGRILDLQAAYALTLTERQQHPRAYEMADAIVPPDMLELLMNGRSGRDAADEALAHLESRLDDPRLTGPDGEQLVYGLDDVKLLAPLPRPSLRRPTRRRRRAGAGH